MKRILIWFFIIGLSVATARAQDDATQQQINKLTGQIQDLQDSIDLQKKRIDALEKEIGDLHDKAGGSANADVASADDLKKLADQVQEIDKKRQEDRDLILKEIEKIGKVSGSSTSSHRPAPTVPITPLPPSETSTSSGTGPQKGYEYTIQRNDTVMAIAKAYRDQGIKVTSEQILKANPGLDPNHMIIGKKIFIPAPAQ